MDCLPATALVILNGKAADNDALREAVLALREAGMSLHVRVTWEGADVPRYVAEAIALGVSSVIAAGGDGTLHQVAAELADIAMQQGQSVALPSLAVLPLGTANDFARGVGMDVERDAGDLLRDVLQWPPRPIDLLHIQTDTAWHWCVNMITGGIGASVTHATEPGLKKHLGALAYAITGLGKLGNSKPVCMRMHGADFNWQGECLVLAIGNGRQAGGGHVLCEGAKLDDGLMDVTLLPATDEDTNWLDLLGTALTEGHHAALGNLAMCARLPQLHIRCDEPFVLSIDGEPIEARDVRIQLQPSVLQMHLPPPCEDAQAAAG